MTSSLVTGELHKRAAANAGKRHNNIGFMTLENHAKTKLIAYI